VALLVGIGACVLGALSLGRLFSGIERAAESYDALTAELGPVEDYVPPAGGVPGADRLEVFVRAREAVAPERRALDELAAAFPPPELEVEHGSTLDRIRAGAAAAGELIDRMGSYLEARDRALLEQGMGPGEYVFLYTLTYHSWLGHAPGEGPAAGARAGIDVYEDDDPLFGEAAVRRRYRRYVLGMLERRAEKAGPGGTALREEIHRMELDPARVLWSDGLPAPVAGALEPWRERLESTWSPSANRLELPLAEHETPWEWR
jgi:hypothetical protein